MPKVVVAGDPKAGDDAPVKVRAPRGSWKREVESTPAAKVAEHELASQV
jgi:hypothetical protein